MRLGLTLCALGVFLSGSDSVQASPSIEIRGASARVVVIPEARGDIVVTQTHPNPRLPLRVRRFGDRVFITGDVAKKTHGCRAPDGHRVVAVWGRGAIPYEQLPELVIRTPLAVSVLVSEAVFGEIGRSASVDFTNQGCGDWTIAPVKDRLRLSQAGSGDVRAADAGPTDLSVVGAGDIATGDIRGGLKAVSSGSGDIKVKSVSGPFDARVAGSGDIVVSGGRATAMTVSIAGSGRVTLVGEAKSLNVTIAGTGDVSVTRVAGAVTKQVFGGGQVRIGR